jgi:hypothetical protein
MSSIPFDPVDEIEGDPEELRRQLEREVGNNPRIIGRVWNRRELEVEFIILGEKAPVIAVQRRSDGVRGSMMTRNNLYWGFEAASEDA